MQASDFLTPEDLTEFLEDVSTAKLAAIILDVWAEVTYRAPSLTEPVALGLSDAQHGLVTSIMRQASIRYEESKAGALSTAQAMAGSYSEMNVIKAAGGLLTSVQVQQLQDLEAAITETSTGVHLQELDTLAGARPSGSSVWHVIGHRSF